MSIIDVLRAPWAITPEALEQICGIYARWQSGEQADLQAVAAQLGRPLGNERAALEVVDGVAVIPLAGPMFKKANLLTEISGATSMQLVASDLRAAQARDDISAVLLDVDSPGGTVDGTEELAAVVRETAAVKPTAAWASGMIASAAYWVGSAAGLLYLSSGTTAAGSIGVATVHEDWSGAAAQRGVKVTDLYAGKYKRIASENGPLTAEGRDYIQGRLDYIYSQFVDAVARHRDVSVERVLADMADGRVLLGQQAVDAGLADGIASRETVIEALRASVDSGAQHRARATVRVSQPDGATAAAGDNDGGVIMPITLEQVVAEAPDVAEALRAEGREQAAMENQSAIERASTDAADDGRAIGAKAERERIQAVLAQSLPGHEALIQGLAFDGKTSGAEAAVAVIQAQQQKQVARGSAVQADAAALGDVTASVGELGASVTDLVADSGLPVEDRAKATWEKSPAVREEFLTLETYTAYLKAEEKGSFKLLRRERDAA